MKIKGKLITDRRPGYRTIYTPCVIVERRILLGLIPIKDIYYLRIDPCVDLEGNPYIRYKLCNVLEGVCFSTYKEAYLALEDAFVEYGMEMLINKLVDA